MKKSIEFSDVNITDLVKETEKGALSRDISSAVFHRYSTTINGRMSRQTTISIRLAGNKRKEIAITTLKALVEQLTFEEIKTLVDNVITLQNLNGDLTLPVSELVNALVERQTGEEG